LPLHLRDVFYERADVWSAATLVVVSACQTGAPDVAAPDEAISWPTAFLLAGVPTVVAAQWPVDDVSTALLMSKFYALLLDPQTSPALDAATALAHAQRWMRTVTIRELRKGVERGELGGAVVEDIAAHVEDSGPHCQPFAGSPFDWAGFAAYGV
jgi:CHAT domain-containing protein